MGKIAEIINTDQKRTFDLSENLTLVFEREVQR